MRRRLSEQNVCGGAALGIHFEVGPLVRSTGYVVVELKAGKFMPEHLGQLNFYVAAVNDMLRLPRQAATVGILVCGSRNERTVRYALDGSAQPLTVTSYTYDALPPRSRRPCRPDGSFRVLVTQKK